MSYAPTDNFAIIAPTINGSISALSSSLIIFFIARSKVRLSTIYHRIMFGMSIVNFLGALAMGLTTLPTPKDLPPGWEESDGLAGNRLGNALTCRAQGFVYIFGMVSMSIYYACISVYYTCAIAFKIKEKIIAKYIEPILHILPLGIALLLATLPLKFDWYHATAYVSWCTVCSSDGQSDIKVKKVTDRLIGL